MRLPGALLFMLVACTDRTADGREIRHACLAGHTEYRAQPVIIGKVILLNTVQVFVCDRERLDTLARMGK